MKEKILKLVKENVFELADKDIQSDSSLISTGLLESFDVINLITVFENEFQIEIKLEELDLEAFNTIDSMEEMIRSYAS